MTKELIKEALKLLDDLKAARDSTDNPILKQQYNNDIKRIENLLDILNNSLNNLTDKKDK